MSRLITRTHQYQIFVPVEQVIEMTNDLRDVNLWYLMIMLQSLDKIQKEVRHPLKRLLNLSINRQIHG